MNNERIINSLGNTIEDTSLEKGMLISNNKVHLERFNKLFIPNSLLYHECLFFSFRV